MAPKLVFLTGAPEANSLNWSEEAGLLTNFEESIARFARLEKPLQTISAISEEETTETSHIDLAYWRSIPLQREHLPTGLSQPINQDEYEGAQFFAPSLINSFIEESTQPVQNQQGSLQPVEQVLSQFYEESYAVHQDIPSSQIDAVSQASSSFSSLILTQSTGSSYDDETTFDSLASSRRLEPQNIPVSGNLSKLKDIPNANYLNSINPQTMTVNLIVGLISVPAPRDINTKRGARVQLIELIVGDETKTGFGINFWLSGSNNSAQESKNQRGQETTSQVLKSLRPQDVVLMKNVALSSFRGRVYGQSLRKDVTKVYLLYRKRVNRTDVGGCYGTGDLEAEARGNLQLEKTKRVREWVQKFVGGGPIEGKRGVGQVFKEVLPPDSLPSQG